MALYALQRDMELGKTDVQATPDNEYHTNTNVLKFRDGSPASDTPSSCPARSSTAFTLERRSV